MYLKELNNKYNVSKVTWGVVRTQNLNDTLDSATVLLSHIEAIDIEPYDVVRLHNENNGDEYYLVADATETYATYTSPFYFDYEVNLMSLTKLLETIQLPNMTITNIGQNRTILSYIQRVVSRYIATNPTITKYFAGVTYDIPSVFSNVCPEMSFSQPTAREYLDWLANLYGYIIQLSIEEASGNYYLQVGMFSLNGTETEMDTTNIKSIVGIHAADDYVTELDHDIQEVIGQEPVVEYIRLKSDGYLFDSDNAKGVLTHKIYDIQKVVVKTTMNLRNAYTYTDSGSGGGSTSDNTISSIDITDYVVLKTVWDTLEFGSLSDKRTIISTSESQTASDQNIGKKTQQNCMYWERGSKLIENPNYTETFKNIIGTGSTMPTICNALIEAWLELNWENPMDPTITAFYENFTITNYDWSNVVIEVTYIPYVSPRFRVEQKDQYTHLISMPDNSTNTSTEIGKFLNYSVEKNSKLGNKSKIFTARSVVSDYDFTPVYHVGEIWFDENDDKYVLTTLEYSIYPAYIVYKGTLTKNYTNRNLNTIINREKRYYSLPDPSESVVRKEVRKRYVKISTATSQDLSRTESTLFGVTPAYASFNSYYDNSEYFNGIIIPTKIIGGNVITYNFAFQDNVSYGSRVGDQLTGGYTMDVLKYCNSDGELQFITFQMYYQYATPTTADLSNLSNFVNPGNVNAYTTMLNQFQESLLKDGREELNFNLEYIFYSDDEDIIVNSKLAEMFDADLQMRFTYTSDGTEYSYNFATTLSAIDNLTYSSQIASGITGTLEIYSGTDVYLTINNYTIDKYINFNITSER